MSPSSRRTLPGLTILLFLLFQIPAAGQDQKVETLRILGISVEGNNSGTGTQSDAIISNAGLNIGDEIQVPGDRILAVVHSVTGRKNKRPGLDGGNRNDLDVRGDVAQTVVSDCVRVVADLGGDPFRRGQQQGVGREEGLVLRIAAP